MAKKKKIKESFSQSELEGYSEGVNTGYLRGYTKGIEDARTVIHDLLEFNGIFMEDSEFDAQFLLMKQEGTIKDPNEHFNN